MQPGQGPGLSLHDLGESAGQETVTLLQSEMPALFHTGRGSSIAGLQRTPVGYYPLLPRVGEPVCIKYRNPAIGTA